MCGIVGIVAKRSFGFSSFQSDLFEDMLKAGALRGEDSTGAFMVTNKNQIPIIKQAVEATMFARTKSWREFQQDITRRGMIVIGHNRKATQGSVSSKNAHPFVKDGIVLVHNGYIGNSSSIDSKVDVDSEAVVTALVESKGKYVDAIERLNGAWALVWYNQKEKKLFLTHNGERPLAICHTDDHMYIASEGGMLEWLLGRRKISHQIPVELKVNNVYEVSWKNFDISAKELPHKVVIPTHRARTMHQSEWLEGDMCGLDMGAFRQRYPEPEMTEPHHPLDRGETKKVFNDVGGDSGMSLMKKMYNAYPQNETVMFVPLDHIIHEMDISVSGVMWSPGKPAFPAGCIMSRTQKSEELIMNWHPKRAPLMAEVAAVARRGEDVRIGVKNVREAKDRLKDANGQEMSAYEWSLICGNFACDTCAKVPQRHQADFVTINRGEDNGKYEIVCADCLTSGVQALKKASEVPTDDKTDRPTVNQ